MGADTELDIELDDAQLRVVEADADERLLVIAGAGQGKTEVVASRLVHLIDDEDLSPSVELLVLSFSRAAVHAVKSRVASRDVAEINVRTFDSFAGQVLLEAGLEPTGSFDERIRQATRWLEQQDETPELIADLRHVVIDEVQDLVGDRVNFVLTILDHLDEDAGLTALGDPLQGVYDFVLLESQSKTTFDEFFSRLGDRYKTTRVALSENYRARGEDCIRVAGLAAELRDLDDEAALEHLRAFSATLPHMDRVADWSFLDLYAGRSAVLCRSNGEVLRTSRALIEQGIRHAVRRPAEAFGASKWLAQALAELPGPLVAQSEVEAAVAERIVGIGTDDAWHLLKAAENSSRNQQQLNLERLRARVRSAAVPLSLTQGDDADIIVSTIHRAKGLEFDNVFIVDSGYEADDEDLSARVRRDYVALSRARDSIVIVHPVRERSFITEYRWLPNRLQERVGKKGATRLNALEFGGADTYVGRPSGAGISDAPAVQRTLESVGVGIPVTGEIDQTRTDIEHPVYTLLANGQEIGHTTDEFGEAFAQGFKVKPGSWPAEITDLVLVSVETTAGDPRFTEAEGLGLGGFWLVPRVVGLARPLWDLMEEVE